MDKSRNTHGVGILNGEGKGRTGLSRLLSLFIFALVIYLASRNRDLIIRAFIDLGVPGVLIVLLATTVAILLSSLAFGILVRHMGYRFTFADSYHCLNASQAAAFLPGKVWGFLGLAGLLWSRGISKGDSLSVIFLNLLIMLSACAAVGLIGLIPVMGWLAVLIFAPLAMLLFQPAFLEAIRSRFLPGVSPMPSRATVAMVFVLGVITWALTAASFAYVVSCSVSKWPASPLFVAGSHAAGYLAGFLSIIAPAGLGVTEGVTAAILSGSMGIEDAFALALSFRVIQTMGQGLNILAAVVMGRPQGRQGPV